MFDTLRACPLCTGRVKKFEKPVVHGSFVDQIVVCSCGWCGVMTEDADDYRPAPVQIQMFGSSM